MLLAALVGGTLLAPLTTAYANPEDAFPQEQVTNYEPPQLGCDDGTFSEKAMCYLANMSYQVLKLAGWVAIMVGTLLNYAMAELVVGMAQFIEGTAGAPNTVVPTTWALLRDIVNVFLVFLTVFIGIATIVGASSYGYKQLLYKVFLAALLVNFSITLSYFVIDVSNYVAMNIYFGIIQQANPSLATCLNTTPVITGNDTCINNGIAGVFLTQLKVATLFSTDGVDPSTPNRYWGIMLVALLGSVFMLILAFVLGAAAFLLIGRFILLVFLVIVSPLGLVAWITGISSAGRKWWHMLLNQSLIAPMLLLMWYLSYVLLEAFWKRPGLGDNLAEAAKHAAGDPGSLADMSSLSIFLIFLIGAGFLILSLMLARSLGAYGATAIMRTGRNWSRAAAGGTFAYTAGAASAMAARNYTRRMAQARAQDEQGRYKDNSVSARMYRTLGRAGIVDRGIQKGLGAGANARVLGTQSFAHRMDEREKADSARQTELNKTARTEAVRTAAQKVKQGPERHTDKDLADARATIARAKQEDVEAVAKDKPRLMQHETVRGALTKKQATTLADKPDVSPEAKSGYLASAYKSDHAAIKGDLVAKAKQTGDQKKVADAYAEEARRIRGMTMQDIDANRTLFVKHPERMKYLAPETFAKVMENKDGKWTDDDLVTAQKGRYGTLFTAATAKDAAHIRTATKDLDLKDLELVGPDAYSSPEFWNALTPKQYVYLTKTKRSNFSQDQLTFAEQARKPYHEQFIDPATKRMDYRAFAAEVDKMGPKDMADLDEKTLETAAKQGLIDRASMQELVKQNLSHKKRAAIQNATQAGPRIVGADGKPITGDNLSPEQQKNVEGLRTYFENPGKFSV